MHEKFENKHNNFMQKTSLFYITIFVLVMAIFSSLLPYPIFSNYSNISEKEMFDINNFNETELQPNSDQTAQILELDFQEINVLLPIGCQFEIFDTTFENSFVAERTGGQNHLDIEPIDKENFENFKNFSQNTLSWNRVAVAVKLNDTAYLPASLATYPHGYKTKSSNCCGHLCLHFKNSKTDGNNKTDSSHQNCVENATKQAKKSLKDQI
jgi:hypothetical protein